MALSTVISSVRPRHRAARLSMEAFQGTLALDWANGQFLTLTATSQQSAAFDANNDRIVMVSLGGASATALGAWIAVGTNPTASAGAGSLWISQSFGPDPIYVPAGMLIAAIWSGVTSQLSMIPALLASDP